MLRSLDTVRARAFATRDARLFSTVYASAALRQQDARTLTRLVRPGCVLIGARTRFTDVHAHRTDRGTLVAARAALQSSRLRCSGRPAAVSPATQPVRVRLLVVRTTAGPRIEREWRVR